jgi:hypothetical protein
MAMAMAAASLRPDREAEAMEEKCRLGHETSFSSRLSSRIKVDKRDGRR